MFDEEDLASIRDSLARWEDDTLDPFLKRGERKDEFETVWNHPVDRQYNPGYVADIEYEEDSGFPGEEPYTLGPYPMMYRGQNWKMRQFAGFGTVEKTNERFHNLIDKGQTGLSTAFEIPTLMGNDFDGSMCVGEFAKEDVAVDIAT